MQQHKPLLLDKQADEWLPGSIEAKSSSSWLKRSVTFALIALGLAAAGFGARALYPLVKSASLTDLLPAQTRPEAQITDALETTSARAAVSALGRLEPQGDIIKLSAPNSLDGTTARIEQFFVKEGDRVTEGQALAVLDSYTRRLAALRQAEAEVKIAEAELANVKAGAKAGDLNAQEATITRLEAELDNAELEYERFEGLYQQGAISASIRDSKKLVVDTTRAQIEQARSALDSIAEVRPADVEVAEAKLNQSRTVVERARGELELTYVRAPFTGQILKVHVKPGEFIGNTGILDIGQTDQMYVTTEVYETDISQVKIGQKAKITNDSVLSDTLQGQVVEIGRQVGQPSIFDINPLGETDNKVVEVKIRLDAASSRKVSNLSNLQVQVVIQL
jgi:HlyD family secretion protein